MRFMKLLLAIAGLLGFAEIAFAASPVRYVQISTNTLTRQSGTAVVQGVNMSTITVSSVTFTSAIASATVTDFTATRATFTFVNILSTVPDFTATRATFTFVNVSSGIHGVTNGSNAGPGLYGQYISSVTTGTSSFGTSNQWANLLQMSIPAGDWICSGLTSMESGGTTNTGMGVVISVNSGTTTSDHVSGNNQMSIGAAFNGALPMSQSVSGYRINITSPTTYYLKVIFINVSGSATFQGRFSCIRSR